MAIIQVSKIQVRSGNISDLPQLSVGEFGWATDQNRLFIGNDTGNIIGPVPKNTEILTSTGTTSAIGVDGAVQFNDGANGNVLGGLPTFTFNSTTNTLNVSNAVISSANISNGNVSGTLAVGGNLNVSGTINGNISGNISGNFVVPGSDNWVLYNNNGLAAASQNFQFDDVASTLTVNGNLSALRVTGDGTGLFNINGANIFGSVGNALRAGTVTGNAQPNITSIGNLANLWMSGNIIPTSNVIYDIGTANRRFRDIYLANSTVYIGNGTISSPNDSGDIVFSNSIIATSGQINGDLYVTGNVTGIGNINIISGNNGQFFGDASGDGALYAGVIGATTVPNVVVQMTGQSELYTQVNLQNKYPGPEATADYVITADNGDDENFFIDIAITSGVFTDPNYGAANSNDAWILVQGDSNVANAATTGGNLIMGTKSPTKTVKIVAGGPNSENISTVFDAPDTAATTPTTGTMVVTGGVGVTGNIVASANVKATNFVGNLTGDVTGNLSAPGNTTQVLFNNAGTIAAAPNVSYTGTTLTVNGTVSSNLFTGVITTPTQPNITTVGTLTNMITSGNANITGSLNLVGGAVIGGGAVINGNLIVNGATEFFNVASLSITDPIISIGGGPNGTPLTSNDGKDRGSVLQYYNGAPVSAFMGWDTSNGEFVFGSNVSVVNDIVTFNSYGNVRADKFFGTFTGQSTTAITVTANAQPNITSVGTLTSLSVSGNIGAGNVAGGNLVQASYLQGTLVTAAQPSITSVGTLGSLAVSGGISASGLSITGGGTINTTNITTGSPGTGGTIIGSWNLAGGSRMTATYADLGERYTSDKDYEPGTILAIGGELETTIVTKDTMYKVAGIVSTEPAYVLNSDIENSVIIALSGRVPCKVIGNIAKGDFIIPSDVPGVGTGSPMPVFGAIVGRALEAYSSTDVGVIEVKVDRG